MSVHLKNINIDKLGPLESLSIDFGKINLIYGFNETGKTYLVEFILKSLFRHASSWHIRDSSTEGSVTVAGLSPEEITFYPSSPKKIEDYWLEKELGLPLNMARMLVVRGGDLDLSENVPGGISKDFLKTALTNQVVLDKIWEEIPPTVRKSSLVDQQITGNNQGEIKEFNNAKIDLSKITNLLEQIDNNYSRGPANLLEIESADLKAKLDEQIQAKRYHAYLISKQIQSLTNEKDQLSDGFLSDLRDHIRDFRANEQELKDLINNISRSSKESDDYSWLETAISIWESSNLDSKGKPSLLPAIIGGGFLGGGLIALVLEQLIQSSSIYISGLAASIVGSIILASYLIRILNWSNSINDSSERALLLESYQEKFGYIPRGQVDFRDQKNKLQEIYLLHKNNQNLRDRKKLEIENNKIKIKALFQDILDQPINEEEWEETFYKLKTKSNELSDEINKLKFELSKLDIPDEDYSIEPGEQSYDPKLIRKLEQDQDKIEVDLAGMYQELETLKLRACDQTGDDRAIPWPELLYNLRNKQEEIQESVTRQTANLVAKIGLSEILTQLQGEEDQKIRNDINTPDVSSMLSKLTGKYQRLDLIEDQLYAVTRYSQYRIEDLSTGAREQIQLALRLGISSHLTDGSPLFLILDDAFQHSDWERRESLVGSMIDLGKQGWQVIYLSMDDHIRDLFHKFGKAAFKDQFRSFNLHG